MLRPIAAAFLLASGCALADGGSVGCESAAWAQADAEQRWGHAIEAHEMLHEAGLVNASEADHAKHDVTAEAIVAARVEMIVAEAETRRQCA